MASLNFHPAAWATPVPKETQSFLRPQAMGTCNISAHSKSLGAPVAYTKNYEPPTQGLISFFETGSPLGTLPGLEFDV